MNFAIGLMLSMKARRVTLRTPTLVLILGLTGATATVAAPVTGWSIVDSSSGGPTGKTLTGAASNSPIIGTGADGSANQLALFANISGAHDLAPDVSLTDGQTVRLTGSATIHGNASSMEQFRFGLFYEAAGPVDANGWQGYLANNSAGNSGGALRAKDRTYADFPNQLFAATAASGSAATLGSSRDGGSFTPGVYDFTMSVTRVGSAAVIDASLTRGSQFAQAWQDAITADPDLATFDFNRVGFLSGNMSADSIAFSNIQVTTVAPPSLTLEIIDSGPDAGRGRLINRSALDVNLDYYEIRSNSGELDPSQWTSIADQSAGDWLEAGGANRYLLSEANFATSLTIAGGDAISLGRIALPAGLSDLRFFQGGEQLIEGTVSYTTPADFNSDGAATANDLPIWRDAYGQGLPTGDANYDGRTDGADFLIWQRQVSNFMSSIVAVVKIPEPRAIHLVLISAVAAMRTRNR